MYSKNVILFFCVALYFTQCQSVNPTPEQLERIRIMVEGYNDPNGLYIERNGDVFIDRHAVYDILAKVAHGLQIRRYRNFRTNEIGSYHIHYFTLSDVLQYVAKYLGQPELTPGKADFVRRLFSLYHKPLGIHFGELRDLLGNIKDSNETLDAEFPYLQEPKTSIPYKMTIGDNKFTKKEVEFIILRILKDSFI